MCFLMLWMLRYLKPYRYWIKLTSTKKISVVDTLILHLLFTFFPFLFFFLFMLIIIWLWKDVGSSVGEGFCEKVGFVLCSKYSWSWVQSLPCSEVSHKWRCFTSFPSGLSNNRVGLREGGQCFVWVFFFNDKGCPVSLKMDSGKKKNQCLKYLKDF